MSTLREKLASLPDGRRRAVEARATALVLEEITLREARKSVRNKTQVEIAGKLGIGQDGVSRLEKRGDMLISTLRQYVAALGGRVRLVVELEGQPPIELKNVGMKAAKPKVQRKTRPSAVA